MKYLKMLGLAAVAAMALMAVTAGSASATTLEVGGVPQNKSITIAASAASSVSLSDTEGAQANTCSVSSVHGSTVETKDASGKVISSFTSPKVTGSLSTEKEKGLSFTTCTRSPVVVTNPGGLIIEWEGGTSGTVYSENADVDVPTTFGFSVTCTTASTGTKIGTLTGVAAGNATMSISAVLSCGFLLPSASWSGTYKVTTPTGLGVVS